MVASASEPILLHSHRKTARWSVLLVFAVVSGMAIWLVYFSMRRPFIGKTDPETGCRFTFTLASEWVSVEKSGPGFSKKLDDLTFSLPKPLPLQTWIEKYLLHWTSYPYKFPFLKNEISIVSGDQILSGNRSPFRNFKLQDDYPTPKHPDFVDLPKTRVMEETHLSVADQPALWRVARVDLPLNPTVPAAQQKGSYKFYTDTLVVKVKGKDLWFAVVGTGDADHQHQVQNEVRSIGDSLRIEKVWGK